MKSKLIYLFLILPFFAFGQVQNDPTGNVQNNVGTTGINLVNAAPQWNPDLPEANRWARVAYNEATGQMWLWQKNKVGPNNGAWIVFSGVARILGDGAPTYTPTNLNEIAVNGSGVIFAYNGSGWTSSKDIYNFVGGQGVAPLVPANSYPLQNWQNSAGEIYYSNGSAWVNVARGDYCKQRISVTANGWQIGQAVKWDGSAWVLGKSDDPANLPYFLIVEKPDANALVITSCVGAIVETSATFADGDYYLLPDGTFSQTAPTSGIIYALFSVVQGGKILVVMDWVNTGGGGGGSQSLGITANDLTLQNSPSIPLDSINYQHSIRVLADAAQYNRVGENFLIVTDEKTGGVFAKVNSGTVDGVMIIQDANGQKYRRQNNGMYNPLWWGAKGDGVTDDKAALQACMDYCHVNGGTVFVPKLTYAISDSIILPAQSKVEGNEATFKLTTHSAGVRLRGGVSLYNLNIDASDNALQFNGRALAAFAQAGTSSLNLTNQTLVVSVKIKGYVGSPTRYGTGIGLYARIISGTNTPVTNCRFYSCDITGFKIGINLKILDRGFVSSNRFTGLTMFDCETFIDLTKSPLQDDLSDNTFDGMIQPNNSQETGVYIARVDGRNNRFFVFGFDWGVFQRKAMVLFTEGASNNLWGFGGTAPYIVDLSAGTGRSRIQTNGFEHDFALDAYAPMTVEQGAPLGNYDNALLYADKFGTVTTSVAPTAGTVDKLFDTDYGNSNSVSFAPSSGEMTIDIDLKNTYAGCKGGGALFLQGGDMQDFPANTMRYVRITNLDTARFRLDAIQYRDAIAPSVHLGAVVTIASSTNVSNAANAVGFRDGLFATILDDGVIVCDFGQVVTPSHPYELIAAINASGGVSYKVEYSLDNITWTTSVASATLNNASFPSYSFAPDSIQMFRSADGTTWEDVWLWRYKAAKGTMKYIPANTLRYVQITNLGSTGIKLDAIQYWNALTPSGQSGAVVAITSSTGVTNPTRAIGHKNDLFATINAGGSIVCDFGQVITPSDLYELYAALAVAGTTSYRVEYSLDNVTWTTSVISAPLTSTVLPSLAYGPYMLEGRPLSAIYAKSYYAGSFRYLRFLIKKNPANGTIKMHKVFAAIPNLPDNLLNGGSVVGRIQESGFEQYQGNSANYSFQFDSEKAHKIIPRASGSYTTITGTLPPSENLREGNSVLIVNVSGASASIVPNGSDVIRGGNISISNNGSAALNRVGTSEWVVESNYIAGGALAGFTPNAVPYADGSGVLTSSSMQYDEANGRLGINVVPTHDIGLEGNATRVIGVERKTSTTNATGQQLTVRAGGARATPAATNAAGGNLILESGISTGSGTSSIRFATPTAGASGTTDRTPVTRMQINDTGVSIGTTSPTSNFHFVGSASETLDIISASTTLNATHRNIVLTAGGLTITLPTPSSTIAGRKYTIVSNGGAGTISTYTDLNGATSTTLHANQSLTFQCTSTTWYRIQ